VIFIQKHLIALVIASRYSNVVKCQIFSGFEAFTANDRSGVSPFTQVVAGDEYI